MSVNVSSSSVADAPGAVHAWLGVFVVGLLGAACSGSASGPDEGFVDGGSERGAQASRGGGGGAAIQFGGGGRGNDGVADVTEAGSDARSGGGTTVGNGGATGKGGDSPSTGGAERKGGEGGTRFVDAGMNNDSATTPPNVLLEGPSGTRLWSLGVDPSPGFDTSATALVADHEAIYILGSSHETSPAMRVEKRRMADAALMTSFGNGALTVVFSESQDRPLDLAIDQSGLYVANAPECVEFDCIYDIDIRKYRTTDGAPVDEFSQIKAWTAHQTTVSDRIHVRGNTLFLAGTMHTLSNGRNDTNFSSAVLEKKDAMSGGILKFGDSWYSFADEQKSNMFTAVTFDERAFYTAGYYSGPPRRENIQKRNQDDGRLDVAFDPGADPREGSEAPTMERLATGVVMAKGALYVVVQDINSDPAEKSTSFWMEKRSPDTGALIKTFGRAGAIEIEHFFEAVADDDALYVSFGEPSEAAGNRVHIEKRSLEDGSLISSFANGGVYVSEVSELLQRPTRRRMLLTKEALFWIGATAGPRNQQWQIEKIAR